MNELAARPGLLLPVLTSRQHAAGTRHLEVQVHPTILAGPDGLQRLQRVLRHRSTAT